ncbi:hypothetical protein H696_01412 [Fonticula alba]|uniref:Uncharacterized protein n=1 Tax=Fonticula alba TaxID=691883 RepID=A0A058ZC71_FONAL|nr:hypothetical protein H696_01412 [Fonticula alba]KCV72005.1 hypothetical protein H696_01412 [Fonticula alba]|eukprot:XP_009493583.1 hypothetical protein H696_01412 [Fonticula alba]
MSPPKYRVVDKPGAKSSAPVPQKKLGPSSGAARTPAADKLEARRPGASVPAPAGTARPPPKSNVAQILTQPGGLLALMQKYLSPGKTTATRPAQPDQLFSLSHQVALWDRPNIAEHIAPALGLTLTAEGVRLRVFPMSEALTPARAREATMHPQGGIPLSWTDPMCTELLDWIDQQLIPPTLLEEFPATGVQAPGADQPPAPALPFYDGHLFALVVDFRPGGRSSLTAGRPGTAAAAAARRILLRPHPLTVRRMALAHAAAATATATATAMPPTEAEVPLALAQAAEQRLYLGELPDLLGVPTPPGVTAIPTAAAAAAAAAAAIAPAVPQMTRLCLDLDDRVLVETIGAHNRGVNHAREASLARVPLAPVVAAPPQAPTSGPARAAPPPTMVPAVPTPPKAPPGGGSLLLDFLESRSRTSTDPGAHPLHHSDPVGSRSFPFGLPLNSVLASWSATPPADGQPEWKPLRFSLRKSVKLSQPNRETSLQLNAHRLEGSASSSHAVEVSLSRCASRAPGAGAAVRPTPVSGPAEPHGSNSPVLMSLPSVFPWAGARLTGPPTEPEQLVRAYFCSADAVKQVLGQLVPSGQVAPVATVSPLAAAGYMINMEAGPSAEGPASPPGYASAHGGHAQMPQSPRAPAEGPEAPVSRKAVPGPAPAPAPAPTPTPSAGVPSRPGASALKSAGKRGGAAVASAARPGKPPAPGTGAGGSASRRPANPATGRSASGSNTASSTPQVSPSSSEAGALSTGSTGGGPTPATTPSQTPSSGLLSVAAAPVERTPPPPGAKPRTGVRKNPPAAGSSDTAGDDAGTEPAPGRTAAAPAGSGGVKRQRVSKKAGSGPTSAGGATASKTVPTAKAAPASKTVPAASKTVPASKSVPARKPPAEETAARPVKAATGAPRAKGAGRATTPVAAGTASSQAGAPSPGRKTGSPSKSAAATTKAATARGAAGAGGRASAPARASAANRPPGGRKTQGAGSK